MRLIRIWDVDVKINILLCFVFFVFFLLGYIENILISFFVVLLHELAHTVVAKIFNYKIKNIELFPFGGVARIEESIAINPKHEVMIALAGPIFNFTLIIMTYPFIEHIQNNEKLLFFIYTNLIIGIFNLMPIIPLDGGRIVRAYLAFLIGVKRSTKVVVKISKAISIIIFLWGCLLTKQSPENVFVPLISIFLFIAAHREHQMAVFIFMKEITQKKQYLLSQGILNTKNLVAVKNTLLKDIMNQFTPRRYHIITVMDKKCNVIGVLTESQVLDGMIKYGMNVTLDQLLRRN